MTITAVRPPEEYLLAFTRALRVAGVHVTQDRAHAFLAATALVGLDDAAATFRVGQATLCASPDDLVRYAQVFEQFFDSRDGLPRTRPAAHPAPVGAMVPESEESAGAGEDAGADVVRPPPATPRCCAIATSAP